MQKRNQKPSFLAAYWEVASPTEARKERRVADVDHKIKLEVDQIEVMNTPQPNTISIDGVEITTLSYVFNLYTDAIEKIEKLQVASIAACVWATFATVSIIALAVAR